MVDAKGTDARGARLSFYCALALFLSNAATVWVFLTTDDLSPTLLSVPLGYLSAVLLLRVSWRIHLY